MACFSRARACFCLARDKYALCHRKSFTKTKDSCSDNKGRGLLIPFTASRTDGPGRRPEEKYRMVLPNPQRRCNETKQITKICWRRTRDPTSKSCEKFGKKTNSWPLLGLSYTALRIRGIKTLNQSCARTRLALGNGDLSPGWMNEHPLPRWGIISWAPHQACFVTIEKPKYTK